ncbi:protein-disulfide reductase DsbD N-terminal domain-containing protein [Lutibacter sp. A80]|uniref:protein-disulfide reductase DsbD N-terminal domain-containing protein n=1 Tax=Lutibacter sp. A80 TaxID=2918453 RepID=UPI001F0669BB|nr:protein-disulfide reductase DsbD N-terminal domain-containing protein [Lutibacter sp. A80]UMB60833.1 protein-disulfide reductase DsbD N-terminal domain-containing protein [Lutibacter sp. A80]
MKKYILIALLIISGTNTMFSQIYTPVKWSTSVENISETEYNLVLKATIENGWHLYSQNVPEDGPIATSFEFEESDDYILIGKVSEEKGHTVDDPIFNMKIKYFNSKAVFKQRIKTSSKTDFKVLGEIEFMVCNDTSCLPPTYEDFTFTIKK